MATHHPASTDAQVVPGSTSLTLSAANAEGHHDDHLDLDSLEHAFDLLQEIRERSVKAAPEFVATVDVALVAIYREICSYSAVRETVTPDPTLRDRVVASLRGDRSRPSKTNDYGPELVPRARLERYVAVSPETELERRAAWGDR